MLQFLNCPIMLPEEHPPPSHKARRPVTQTDLINILEQRNFEILHSTSQNTGNRIIMVNTALSANKHGATMGLTPDCGAPVWLFPADEI